MSSSCPHQQSTIVANTHFHWSDLALWKQSAHNTAWCLLGCSIGDLGTIVWFQFNAPQTNPLWVMSLAIVNGLITSIILETVILHKQMPWRIAFKTAIGMSLISMIAMEAAMNTTDYLLVGGAKLTWWSVPLMLIVGFLTPWPYNYWRLKKLGKACH